MSGNQVIWNRTGRIWIDGVEIKFCTDVNLHQDINGHTVLSVEFAPQSVIQGEPKQEIIDALYGQGVSDPDATVDITKAIESAKARAERKP